MKIYLLSFFLFVSSIYGDDENCVHSFSSSGNNYDLSRAYTGSDLKSPADNHGNQYYYISPCHNTQICSKATSASPVCQQDGVGSLHSCGTLSSGIWEEMGNGGGVKIKYINGDNGRSSTINYKCDPSTLGYFYQNPYDDGNKNFQIYYSTKYACPVNNTDNYCTYSSPSGNFYDISGAYTGSDLKTGPDSTGVQYYFINPCHKTTSCTNSTNPSSSVCQQDGVGNMHSCGTLESGVWTEIEDGKVEIHYTGGDNGRSSTITYTCDKNSEGYFSNSPTENPSKNYQIYYNTKYACPSNYVEYCSHTFLTTGNKYDISGAYNPNTDLRTGPDNTSVQYYYINPCHNTLSCSNSSELSPVCQQDGVGLFHSCGKVESGVWTEIGDGDGFIISYSDGENGRSSEVYYYCDPNSDGYFFEDPKEIESKKYKISYSTKYACPQNTIQIN